MSLWVSALRQKHRKNCIICKVLWRFQRFNLKKMQPSGLARHLAVICPDSGWVYLSTALLMPASLEPTNDLWRVLIALAALYLSQGECSLWRTEGQDQAGHEIWCRRTSVPLSSSSRYLQLLPRRPERRSVNLVPGEDDPIISCPEASSWILVASILAEIEDGFQHGTSSPSRVLASASLRPRVSRLIFFEVIQSWQEQCSSSKIMSRNQHFFFCERVWKCPGDLTYVILAAGKEMSVTEHDMDQLLQAAKTTIISTIIGGRCPNRVTSQIVSTVLISSAKIFPSEMIIALLACTSTA